MVSIGVFIGRFQPLHVSHLHIILQMLAENDRCIIVVGSVNSCDFNKNPLSFEIRKNMILEAVKVVNSCLISKISILPLNDTQLSDGSYHERNILWCSWLNKLLTTTIDEFKKTNSDSIYKTFLYGSNKDESTQEYLKYILENVHVIDGTKYIEPHQYIGKVRSSTDIRNEVLKFHSNEIDKNDLIKFVLTNVPSGASDIYLNFIGDNACGSNF